MMYGLKWNVVSHISPASVLSSAFPFFLFFFFRWGSTISSRKKKARTLITFQQEGIVSKYSWTSLPWGKKKVAILDSVYGPCPPRKKNGRCRGVTAGGHCREVVVSGGSTVFRNSSECLNQINRTLHNLNLTSTNREKPDEFSSLQSKAVTTKWTLKD